MSKPKVQAFRADGTPIKLRGVEREPSPATPPPLDFAQGMAEIRRAIRKAIVEIEALEQLLATPAGQEKSRGERAPGLGQLPALANLLQSPGIQKAVGSLLNGLTEKSRVN